MAQETYSMHEALVWPLPIKDKRKKPTMPPKQINVIEKNHIEILYNRFVICNEFPYIF